MRLNQFEMIVALERCGSLSQAAEALYMSQPSISKAIRELEDELGYDVLIRKKDGVAFTAKGNEVLAMSKEILAIIGHMRSLGDAVDDSVTDSIAIGGTRFLAKRIFAVIMEIKAQYPNVTIQLSEQFSSEVIEGVRDGALDLGIVMMYSSDAAEMLAAIEAAGLEYTPIYDDSVGLYVKPQHPLHGAGPVALEQVLDYPYVTGGNGMVAKSIADFFRERGYEKRVELISNAQLRLQYLYERDAVISLPSRVYGASADYRRALTLLEVAGLDWQCQVGLVHREGALSPLLEQVMARLVREIQ